MSKTVEFEVYVGDFVWFIDESIRNFVSDKVININIDSYGAIEFNTKTYDKYFTSTDIGVNVWVEKPKDYAGTIVVKNKLASYIGKPLFDTFAKEWVLVNDKTDDYVVIVDSLNVKKSIALTGYGSCWGLSETEVEQHE